MDEIPKWLEAAWATLAEVNTVEVEGAAIRYRQWGTPGERDIILVHGGAAHARWWDHIAPLLTTRGRVVALDLSGHGDSDRRPEYSMETWGREVLAVSADAGLTHPAVVGHSLGGLVTLLLAGTQGSGVDEAIVIDSPVGGGNTRRPPESEELITRKPRVYPTAEDAVSHFRPVPSQRSIPVIADYVARNSVHEVDGAWTWKFDARLFAHATGVASEVSPHVKRLAYFGAEFGLPLPDARSIIEESGAIYVQIPDAGHAPMLDYPVALITGIRAILASWSNQ